MAPQLKTAIDNLIQSNKVVVFIKVRGAGAARHRGRTAGRQQAYHRLHLLNTIWSSWQPQ
jgi:hypothetical protein